jgi:hypothetical protein
MVVSKLDQYPMKLACHCSQITNVTIGYFDSAPTFTCPVCGTVTDTRDEPYRSFLIDWRELATELDKHATQRGEVVERLK